MRKQIYTVRSSTLLVVFLTLLTISSLAQGSCTTSSDCSWSFYHCCKKANFGLGKCSSDCVNEACSTKGDCADNERCRNSICRKEPRDGECDSDSDCEGIYSHCCEKSGVADNVCSSNCLGFTCSQSSDCGPNEHCRNDGICITKPSDGECDSDTDCKNSYYSTEYCCERIFSDDNKCAINCIYDSCNTDSNCAPDECCENGVCTSVCDITLAGWNIAVIVISIIITIATPVTIIICCYCGVWAATRPRPQQQMVYRTSQPNQTTVLATQTIQNQQADAQPNPQQPPPSYPATQHPPTQQPYPPTHQYPVAQKPYPPANQGYPLTQQGYPPPTQQPYPPQQAYPAQPHPEGPPPSYAPPPYPDPNLPANNA